MYIVDDLFRDLEVGKDTNLSSVVDGARSGVNAPDKEGDNTPPVKKKFPWVATAIIVAGTYFLTR
jgi:hypothetical protein